jgi:hypothetical protein
MSWGEGVGLFSIQESTFCMMGALAEREREREKQRERKRRRQTDRQTDR